MMGGEVTMLNRISLIDVIIATVLVWAGLRVTMFAVKLIIFALVCGFIYNIIKHWRNT